MREWRLCLCFVPSILNASNNNAPDRYMKFVRHTLLSRVTRSVITWHVLFLLVGLFSGRALAQFAYQCDRANGATFISKSPCPAGMTWARIRTDPYYTGSDPLSGVKPVENISQNQPQRAPSKGKAALASTGNPAVDQAAEDYRRAIDHGTLGEYAAAKTKLKVLMGAGSTPQPAPNYVVKDAFGNYQQSNGCFQFKDAFGNYQWSQGCSNR